MCTVVCIRGLQRNRTNKMCIEGCMCVYIYIYIYIYICVCVCVCIYIFPKYRFSLGKLIFFFFLEKIDLLLPNLLSHLNFFFNFILFLNFT